MQNTQKLFVASLVAIVLSVVVWQLDWAAQPVPLPVPVPSGLQFDRHHPELVGSAPRSPKWPAFRRDYLVENPGCAACGTLEDVELHHVQPFHDRPDLELSRSNVIGLCRRHHFELGHRCSTGKSNWGLCSNPDIREDAEKWRREHKLPPSPLR